MMGVSRISTCSKSATTNFSLDKSIFSCYIGIINDDSYSKGENMAGRYAKDRDRWAKKRFNRLENTRRDVFQNPDVVYPVDTLMAFIHGRSYYHNGILRNSVPWSLDAREYTLPGFIAAIRANKAAILRTHRFSYSTWEYLDDLLDGIM